MENFQFSFQMHLELEPRAYHHGYPHRLSILFLDASPVPRMSSYPAERLSILFLDASARSKPTSKQLRVFQFSFQMHHCYALDASGSDTKILSILFLDASRIYVSTIYYHRIYAFNSFFRCIFSILLFCYCCRELSILFLDASVTITVYAKFKRFAFNSLFRCITRSRDC